MIRDDARALLPSAAVLGGCMLVGLVLGGLLLGSQIRDIKLADRYVTVKGLVERTVKSDSAIWTLSYKESGDDLKAVYAKSQTDQAAVLKFLGQQGIAAREIAVGQINVNDRLTNDNANGGKNGGRYILQQTIDVSSPDVDKIAAVGPKTAELVQAGIVLSASIVYKFNGLNALKPDMITEATQNARKSAARFAADSGAQVGSIRSASQGVFSISAADAGSSTGDDAVAYNGDQQADSSLMKKVRVVSTIDYYLMK
ncbi:MAG: SIMPL domain-containing protein [Acidobacteriota bacterium]|nr:SIMPL domain-containing protein [Acidobacteriota bacterium]